MESQVTNAAQVICPVCETELLADAVFCDEMRSPAEESGDLPRFLSAVPQDAKLCDQCGTRLS
jgi:hypothetical protein